MKINNLNQPIEVQRPITIAGSRTPKATARVAEFTDSGIVGIDGLAPTCELHICQARGKPANLSFTPKPTAQLTFSTGHKMPNRWHRFWQRVLLGWRWERLKWR